MRFVLHTNTTRAKRKESKAQGMNVATLLVFTRQQKHAVAADQAQK
jgi:hypothetical protein